MGELREMFPVYLLAGFLDSGKTTFINNILRDGFAEEDKTLLISTEEGEVEYDESALKNVTILTVDDPDLLTPEFLLFEQKKCGATQIIVELNGMWNLQDFYGAMPENWILYQIVALADARTFEMYSRNMTAQTMDKLRNADMIILKHCNEELRLALRQRNLRLVNRQADIFLENEDGTSEDYMDGTVSAFDLTAPVIEIKDEDYAVFYRDLSEDMSRYNGKTIKFKGIVARDGKMGANSLLAGRHVMTCCADDIAYHPLVCIFAEANTAKTGDWITVTGKIRVEAHKLYRGEGPVLYAERSEFAVKPAQEVATFY